MMYGFSISICNSSAFGCVQLEVNSWRLKKGCKARWNGIINLLAMKYESLDKLQWTFFLPFSLSDSPES